MLKDRLLPLAASLAGVGVLYGLLAGRGDEGVETGEARPPRGYYLRGATLTELGVDGRPRVVLRADEIEQQTSDQSVRLDALTMDYSTTDSGTWTVTAEHGRMPPDRGSIILTGDVTLTGREQRGTAVIRTDRLTYDTVANLISTSEPVDVQIGAHRLSGRGLRADLNAGTLRLESGVHGQFNP